MGALLILTGGWASDGTKEVLEAFLRTEAVWPYPRYLTFPIYVLTFSLVVIGTAWVGKRYFLPRTRFMNNVESPEKREHLVLFLSDLDTSRGGYCDGVPESLTLSDDLDADIHHIENLKQTQRLMWRWEMPLRAIRHHIGKLKTITLICSPESICQVRWFCAILERYLDLKNNTFWIYGKEEHRASLIKCTDLATHRLEGWNFEAFDDLSRALLQRLRMFRKAGINEKEIMIDFTGGQKVTSVVAAMVTINRQVKTQYVQTNRPWGVGGYDIQMGSGETGGLGS